MGKKFTNRVSIYLSDQELQTVVEKAEAAGDPVSGFIRKLICKTYLKKR